MCMLFLIFNGLAKAGEFKLIVASNRDEFYDRPTLSVNEWQENQFKIYGGRDLKDENLGTWLAISSNKKTIKLGSLLNMMGGQKNVEKSRGILVTDYMSSDQTNDQYMKNVLIKADDFSGFNLVLIELNDQIGSGLYCANQPHIYNELMQQVAYVFGNVPPLTPFKKMESGKELFKKIIDKNLTKSDLIQNLLQMLKDRKIHWPDEEMIKRKSQFGEQISSIFVEIDKVRYGTRTHSIILIDSDNKMDYYEETLIDRETNEWKTTQLTEQL